MQTNADLLDRDYLYDSLFVCPCCWQSDSEKSSIPVEESMFYAMFILKDLTHKGDNMQNSHIYHGPVTGSTKPFIDTHCFLQVSLGMWSLRLQEYTETHNWYDHWYVLIIIQGSVGDQVRRITQIVSAKSLMECHHNEGWWQQTFPDPGLVHVIVFHQPVSQPTQVRWQIRTEDAGESIKQKIWKNMLHRLNINLD